MRKIREIYTSTFWDAIIQTGTCALSEEVMTRRECLKKYEDKYWYSENKERWIFYLPDETRKEGRKQVSRKRRKDIEDIVYEYYFEKEKKSEEEKKREVIKNMTFKELFYEYMEHKKTQVKSGTVSRMMVDWEKFYEPNQMFVNKPFTDITKVDVDDFLNNVGGRYNPKNKCFRNMCCILKQTFEYAVDMGYIDKSPYRTTKVNRKNIKPDRRDENKKAVFTLEERNLITAELYRSSERNDMYLVPWIILLDFEIGARIGEILALRESDIEGDKIHIQRQLTKEANVEDLNNIKTKGWTISDYTKSPHSNRKVPLTNTAIECLKHIKTINKRKGKQNEDYLFYNPDDVITENRVKSLLYRMCNKVNIPTRGVHIIRKTYASNLYANDVSISDISYLLGHADESTTLKYYIFSMDDTEERDRKVREALRPQDTQKKYEVSESTKVNHNIICFPADRMTQKPHKIKNFYI